MFGVNWKKCVRLWMRVKGAYNSNELANQKRKTRQEKVRVRRGFMHDDVI
jgi:hypothetical protein